MASGGSRQGLIHQSLALENLRPTFLNPGLPSLGLFGGGKIKDVGSLSPGRQGLEGGFEGSGFI